MKCLILAAGYATRLYPLTENFPKPLLEVNGKTILDWLVDDIQGSGFVEEYIVISNHKFAKQFEKWAEGRDENITVLDDGTSTNETRLGAVRDIMFAIDKLKIDDDLLIIAGDNLLDFSLNGFVEYAKEKNASCIMRYFEPSLEKLRKTGVIELDENGRVLAMEEKPALPRSHWCAPPFYYYKREDTKLVKEGIEEGCGTDAPGHFIAWLCTKTPVFAYEMPGKRYDIGDIKSYEDVKNTYNGII
ncbi:MAG: nucleotidyltransferase family protein [Clostridia bacterium]|nr:nucleotidyltransferase family protein [Clostridia bacterium]